MKILQFPHASPGGGQFPRPCANAGCHAEETPHGDLRPYLPLSSLPGGRDHRHLWRWGCGKEILPAGEGLRLGEMRGHRGQERRKHRHSGHSRGSRGCPQTVQVRQGTDLHDQ